MKYLECNVHLCTNKVIHILLQSIPYVLFIQMYIVSVVDLRLDQVLCFVSSDWGQCCSSKPFIC